MFTVHQPKLINPVELNPAAYNPRHMPPEKFEALKASITLDGLVQSVVVQKKGMKIVGGHQTVRAVKELAVEACVPPPAIPCIVLDIDDARAKKLNIKLNKIKGDFEARLLGELLVDLYDDPKQVTLEEATHLGFTEDEVAKHMHLIEPPTTTLDEGAPPKTFGKSITLSLEFTTVADRDRVKKILADRVALEMKKTGDLVAALLTPRKRESKAKTKRRKAA